MVPKLPNRANDAGLTLIEVLVVIVMVGIMSGVVGLSIGNTGRDQRASKEADLLIARLNRAADEVMLTGQSLSFTWAQDGYKFAVREGDGWVPHPLPILNIAHTLPNAVRISQDAGTITLSGDMVPNTNEAVLIDLVTPDRQPEHIIFDGINAQRLESDI